MSKLRMLLLRAYTGHAESLLTLVEKFKPLLTKYAYLLNYEDAYFDLQLSLIELIKLNNPELIRSHNDGSLVNYIRQSIYHSYLCISKERARSKTFLISMPFDNGNDDEYSSQWDKLCFEQDSHKWIEFDFLYSMLTRREAEIVIQHFWMGLTINEIARKYQVSAPAITQSKSNAIKKLRTILCESTALQCSADIKFKK